MKAKNCSTIDVRRMSVVKESLRLLGEVDAVELAQVVGGFSGGQSSDGGKPVPTPPAI